MKILNSIRQKHLAAEKNRNVFFLDSDDSEIELPKNSPFKEHFVADTNFMKMYKQQNEIHCLDREKSIHVMKNLVIPKKADFSKHLHLNRNRYREEAYDIDLSVKDLIDLQQMEEVKLEESKSVDESIAGHEHPDSPGLPRRSSQQ